VPPIDDLRLITRFDSYQDRTRPPAGGTNMVVTFATGQHDEFYVVVDTLAGSARVQLAWSVDPMPAEDQFQWLKVLLPGRQGTLELDLARQTDRVYTNGIYFAFEATNNTYSSLARVNTDWTSWPSVVRVGPTQTPVVFLMSDPLFGSTTELDLRDGLSRTLGGLSFKFYSAARAQAVLAARPVLRITRDSTGLMLYWSGGQAAVESAPTVNGPWGLMFQDPADEGTLHLSLNGGSQFYRLGPALGATR
jgi:hypothetical protein